MSFGLVTVLFAALLTAPNAGPAADQSAAVRGQLKQALEAAQEMKEGKFKEYALGNIGLTTAHSGDIAGAQAVVRRIKSPEQAASVLAAVGLVQAKQGDRDGAKKTLAEAVRRAKQVKHPQTERELLHAIISAHLAGEQYAEAAQLASTFDDQLDRCYARIDIVEAYADAGRDKEAKDELRNLTKSFRRTLDPFDMMAWEQIWQLHLELDDVDEALKLARAIPKRRYEASQALRDAALHQAKSGDRTAAAATLAEAFQAAGQIEGRERDRELHMGWMVSAQAKVGDMAGALKNLEKIPDGASKAEAMGDVAKAQAKAGDRSTAKATLKRAIAMAEQEVDTWTCLRVLASLAQSQASIGEKAAARITIGKALEAAGSSSHFSRSAIIAEAQIEIGDRAGAKKTLDEVAHRIRAFRTAESRGDAARTIAKAQVDAGFHDAARVTVREIFLPAITPDDWLDRKEATILLAKAGDFAGAYEAARKQDPESRLNGIHTVAAYHTLAKGPDPPAALADKETDPLVRSALHLGIALGLLKKRGVEVRCHYGQPLIDAGLY